LKIVKRRWHYDLRKFSFCSRQYFLVAVILLPILQHYRKEHTTFVCNPSRSDYTVGDQRTQKKLASGMIGLDCAGRLMCRHSFKMRLHGDFWRISRCRSFGRDVSRLPDEPRRRRQDAED